MNFVDAKCEVNGSKVNLKVGPYTITLSEQKSKALIDGGYAGKTVVMGIRPEDLYDSDEMLAKYADSVIEAKINVYELLGAEVYLYFDLEGANMTARVSPTTTARTGSSVKFALDVEKIHVFDKDSELTIVN